MTRSSWTRVSLRHPARGRAGTAATHVDRPPGAIVMARDATVAPGRDETHLTVSRPGMMVRPNAPAEGRPKMSRRKHLAVRAPSGAISRRNKGLGEVLPPTEVRRLAETAAAGLRDAIWSTQLGRLYAVGKISASEFASGKFWREVVAEYSLACQSPRPPRSAQLDAIARTSARQDRSARYRAAQTLFSRLAARRA